MTDKALEPFLQNPLYTLINIH